MRTSRGSLAIYSAVLLAVGFAGGAVFSRDAVAHAQTAGRIFEIRTYTAPPGKLELLHKRFRDHTLRIFEKHGMTNVGYFKPVDPPLAENTLIYVISHKSREAAKLSWAAFGKDPEWTKVAADSQVDGRIVERVVSVFADATDYSPIK